MRKRKVIIPRPRSKFILVRCPSCENEQVIFNYATSVVRCLVCDEILAKPTGGKAEIIAKKLKELE
ncbi:MAG: 30S ribosomal protein S27e [Thermoprotei archaeon]|nr:MAG: 30S ribosomal protein S27e [Thermoprotei archaeon]